MKASRKRQFNRDGFLALICLCLAYLSFNYAMYQISPFGTVLMEEYSMSGSQYTLLSTAPMAAGILLSLPCGMLIDRFGPKKTIGTCIAISAAGSILRVLSTSAAMLILAGFLVGFSSAPISAGASKTLAGYYPLEKVGPRVGIVSAAGTSGATIALAVSAHFDNYHTAFRTSAFLGLAAALCWAALVRRAPSGTDTAMEKGQMFAGIRASLGSRSLAVVALSFSLVTAGNLSFSTFAPSALMARGIPATAAGSYTSFITMGGLAGSLAAPFVFSRVRNRRAGYVVLGAVAAGCAFFSWQADSPALIMGGFFLMGMCSFGLIPLMMAMPITLPGIGAAYAGVAGGVVATFQAIGAVIIPTYVIAPLSGGRYVVLFAMSAACRLAAGILLSLVKTGENEKRSALST